MGVGPLPAPSSFYLVPLVPLVGPTATQHRAHTITSGLMPASQTAGNKALLMLAPGLTVYQ